MTIASETNERPFGVWTAASLVVGLMIGVGIYSLPAQLANYGWTGVVAWLIAGAGTLCCAVPLARVVAARPGEPSLMTLCGSVLGQWVGLMAGWSYWVSVWCGNALVATVIVEYGLSPLLGTEPSSLMIGVVGSLLLLANTAINLAGVREAGRTQVVLTTLKLLPLVAVLVMLGQIALSPQRHFSGLPLAPFHWDGITPAITMTFFALVGFECAGMVAERVRDPARNVARATLLGMVGTTLAYLVLSTGIVMAVPRAALATTEVPIANFAAQMWGNWAGVSVALFAAISGLGVMNAQTLLLGEVPLGLARGGDLPGWIAKTNRRDVAVAPLLVGNALAILLLTGSATELGADLLAFLLKLTTAVSIWLYVAICLAALKMGLARGWAVAGTLFCAVVLYGSGLEAGGLAIVLMIAGIPLYLLATRLTPASAQPSRP